MYTDVDKEERMLTKRHAPNKERKKTGRFRQNLHRYGWVASIALLLICGNTIFNVIIQKKQSRRFGMY